MKFKVRMLSLTDNLLGGFKRSLPKMERNKYVSLCLEGVEYIPKYNEGRLGDHVSKEVLDVEVVNRTSRPLLRREEVDFTVKHMGKPTPSLLAVRGRLAEALGVKVETLLIRYIKTPTNSWMSKGHAHVYETMDALNSFEPLHYRIRNLPKDEREKILSELKAKKETGKGE